MSKLKQLKFATEAAITILRIDDMIKLEQEPSKESGYQQALKSGQLGWNCLITTAWKISVHGYRTKKHLAFTIFLDSYMR